MSAYNSEIQNLNRANERVNTVIQLLSEFKNPEIHTYLDIGSGDGSIAVNLKDSLNIDTAYSSDIITPVKKYSDLIYLTIDPETNILNIPDNSINLITAFVSLHHIKNIKDMINEINRISIKDYTFLIIREHDCTLYTQPYLDFIHLLEYIKYNKLDFTDYVGNYYNRLNLKQSLENQGWKYIKSVDYPDNIPNPQRLYSSLFLFTGIKNAWVDPVVISTRYTLKDDTLFNYIKNIKNYNEYNNYLKVLYKHKITKNIAISLLKSTNISEFVGNYNKIF
jgi:ubiquinone/menaquinone biosynthesis C-methylase UbiE